MQNISSTFAPPHSSPPYLPSTSPFSRCTSIQENGERCSKKTKDDGSVFCNTHYNMWNASYRKYKRVDKAVLEYIPKDVSIEKLLKMYSTCHEAYKRRVDFRDKAIHKTMWDLGHEIRINTLWNILHNIYKKIEEVFHGREATVTDSIIKETDESSSKALEEVIEKENIQQEVKNVKKLQKKVNKKEEWDVEINKVLEQDKKILDEYTIMLRNLVDHLKFKHQKDVDEFILYLSDWKSIVIHLEYVAECLHKMRNKTVTIYDSHFKFLKYTEAKDNMCECDCTVWFIKHYYDKLPYLLTLFYLSRSKEAFHTFSYKILCCNRILIEKFNGIKTNITFHGTHFHTEKDECPIDKDCIYYRRWDSDVVKDILKNVGDEYIVDADLAHIDGVPLRFMISDYTNKKGYLVRYDDTVKVYDEKE